MLKIDNFEVLGWKHTIRGMRNPMNSWEKSDSNYCANMDCDACLFYFDGVHQCGDLEGLDFMVGKNDHDLMMRLRKAGTDHRKFMRMITVYLDIIAPLYWWKEFDTYKVGTVANSCSTMHKIAEKEFALEDFSCEHLFGDYEYEITPSAYLNKMFPKFEEKDGGMCFWQPVLILETVIAGLNFYRQRYLETKEKNYWWQMIQLLPSSYNQKRTVMLNYEVLANIYKSRKDHKLDEWHTFCHWIEELPYSEIILGHYSDSEEC